MNRIVKLVYTRAIVNCPKHSGRFSAVQKENAETPAKFQLDNKKWSGRENILNKLSVELVEQKIIISFGFNTDHMKYLCRRNLANVQYRNFSSSFQKRDEQSIEEEAERKIVWLLKLIFFGTASVVAYNLFPYMGENLMQQSISLLHVKDPLFKRMGASRLARFALDDNKRMKIVELGGDRELVNMLANAKDDHTRKAALKALVAISKSDEAVGALHEAGAIAVIRSTPHSVEYKEIEKYKLNLLRRFQDLRYDISS